MNRFIKTVIVALAGVNFGILSVANGAVTTTTFQFVASSFEIGAPQNSVVGSLTLSYDPTLNYFSAPVDAVSLTIAGHAYTPAEIAFNYIPGSLQIGALAGSVGAVSILSNDFLLNATPGIESFVYATPSTRAFDARLVTITTIGAAPATSIPILSAGAMAVLLLLIVGYGMGVLTKQRHA